MKVEYSNRATADLRKISAYSRDTFGELVTESLEARIRAVVDHISRGPLSAPQLEQKPHTRVVSLVRFPFKIFYRVYPDRIRIQHIRHTARRPWTGR